MRAGRRLTPQSVSAFLGQQAERSRRCGPTTTQGFVVRRDPEFPDGVVVEYEPGTRAARNSTPERLLKIKQSTLGEYRERLVRRYRVGVNCQENPQAWNKLLVQDDGEDET